MSRPVRSYATFFVIAVETLGLVFMLATRERSKHDAPAEILEPEATAGDAGADGGADAGAALQGGADDGGSLAPAYPPRPLRVTSLGWELVAPGAAMTPADAGGPEGGAPGAGSALPMELAPEATLDAVEARLARGGADPQGADVAVLPLPAFVASFERLRALEPRAFLVVGFSHGREEVHAAPGALLKPPPAGDEVRLAAVTSQLEADPAARAAGSESATLLGLFTLDLLGVAPSRVRIVLPGSPDAKTALASAVVAGAPDERKIAFTTAEASRLVPIVAVAPKAVLDAREPVLREWSKAWLDGQDREGGDVPTLARQLANRSGLPLAAGVGGAPEALVLVARLGRIDRVKVAGQSSLIGPFAKPPASSVPLDALMQRTWQLERGAGVVTSAAPEPLPIDPRVVSAIGAPPPSPPPSAPEDVPLGPIPAGAIPLVVYRATAADATVDSVAAQLQLLAGVFDRGLLRISAKGGAKAATAIATAARARGVPAARLATATSEPQGAFASVEILSPP